MTYNLTTCQPIIPRVITNAVRSVGADPDNFTIQMVPDYIDNKTILYFLCKVCNITHSVPDIGQGFEPISLDKVVEEVVNFTKNHIHETVSVPEIQSGRKFR